MTVLKVEKREGTGKYVAFDMRKRGFIPGVIYGKGSDNLNISVPVKEFELLLRKGERMVDMDLDGKALKVLAQAVQHGTYDRQIIHADFMEVRADQKLNISVEIELHGDSVGSQAGGVVEQSMFNVDIECLPKDIPEKIELDISELKVDDVLHVAQLPKIEGVTYTTDEELAVVSCHMHAEEEEAEAAEGEEESGEPEVIGEKKEEE